MSRLVIHRCECEICQTPGRHPVKAQHRRLNVLLAYLDERQQRWAAACEALRLGYGGVRAIARITGLAEKTIRRGCRELRGQLPRGSPQRVRRRGAGRPPAEKKFRGS